MAHPSVKSPPLSLKHEPNPPVAASHHSTSRANNPPIALNPPLLKLRELFGDVGEYQSPVPSNHTLHSRQQFCEETTQIPETPSTLSSGESLASVSRLHGQHLHHQCKYVHWWD